MAHELQLMMGIFTLFNAGYLYWNQSRNRTWRDDQDKFGLMLASASLILGVCTIGAYMAELQVDSLMQTLADAASQTGASMQGANQ